MDPHRTKSPIKIGLSSYAFRWAVGTPDFPIEKPLSVAGFLDKAAGMGAETVQICENFPLHTFTSSDLTSIVQQAESLGLSLELGFRGADPARLSRHLSMAKQLNAGILRAVIADSDWKPSLKRQEQALTAFLPELVDSSVTLALENHFFFKPRELAELVRRVGDARVRVCLDPLNSMSLLVGPQETTDRLAPLAVTVHAKDGEMANFNTGYHLRGCPLGEGRVDFPGLLARLRDLAQVRSIHVETWMDKTDSPDDTLKKEQRWAAHGVRYLKELLNTRQ